MSDSKNKERGSRLALQDLMPRQGVQGTGARPQVIFGMVEHRRTADHNRAGDKHTETEG